MQPTNDRFDVIPTATIEVQNPSDIIQLNSDGGKSAQVSIRLCIVQSFIFYALLIQTLSVLLSKYSI